MVLESGSFLLLKRDCLLEAEEVAQWVMHLSHKHEDPSSDPQPHIKKKKSPACVLDSFRKQISGALGLPNITNILDSPGPSPWLPWTLQLPPVVQTQPGR